MDKNQIQSANHDPQQLIEAYDLLHSSIKQKNQTQKHIDILNDRLGLICQFIIWGEKKNDTFFDYFCDQNTVNLFWKLLETYDNREVQVQVIKTITMLLFNLTKQTTLNYILSHSDLNRIITRDFNTNDDEIIAFYINLYKGISMRINDQNISLFFNYKFSTFPLLMRAISFYSHNDNLVRTSIRNIVLCLTKVQTPEFRRYIQNFPFILFYIQFSAFVNDHLNRINDLLLEYSKVKQNNLKYLLDDQIDILYFLEDLLQSNQDVQEIIINSILAYGFIPNLLLKLIEHPKMIKQSIYQLILIFKTFTQKPLLDFLLLFIFGRQRILQDILIQLCQHNKLVTYRQQSSMVSVWYQEEKFLKAYSQYIYQNGQLEIDNTNHQIVTSPSEVRLDLDFFTLMLKGTDQYRKYELVVEIQNISHVLGIEIIAKYEESNINKQITTPLRVLSEFRTNKLQDLTIERKSQQSFYDNIILCIQSKDDNEVFLALTLIKTIRHSKFISHDILLETGMLQVGKNQNFDSQNQHIDPQQVESRNIFLGHLLIVLESRGESTSLQTYNIAAQLFLDYSKIDKDTYFLEETMKQKFIEILRKQLRLLKSYVVNSFDFLQFLYMVEYFQTEFKYFNTNPLQYWPNLDFTLLTPEMEDMEQKPLHEDTLKKVKKNMQILHILKYLMDFVIRFSQDEQEQILELDKTNPFKKQQNQMRDLEEDIIEDQQKLVYSCQLGGSEIFIIDDDYCLLIAERVGDKYRTKEFYNFKTLDDRPDIKDKKKILFTTKVKEGFKEFNLTFQSIQICEEVTRLINTKRNQIINDEIQFMLNYFKYLENQLN